MLTFSRSSVLSAAVLMGLVWVQTASAQRQPPGDAPGSNLTATATVAGGYDTDLTGVGIDSSTQASAPHVGSALTLNYRTRSERVGFGTRGSVDTRHYRTVPSLTSTAFNGSAVFSAEATSRLRVNASLTSAYAPQFVFSVLPVTSVIPAEAPPPTTDYGVFLQDSVNFTAATSASLNVSRRSELTMSVGGGRYKFLGGDYAQYGSTSGTYGVRYSYTATRNTTLRVGYMAIEASYPAFQGQPKSSVRQRSIDAGINYSRPLSLSRRTTLSFATGSGAIDDGIEKFFTVTGNATLRHEMGRTWATAVVYTRGLGVVGGFARPFFADAVNLEIEGLMATRVSFVASGGYANGTIGMGSRGNNYASYQGTARIEYALKRERIGIFGNYFYYGYEFQNLPDAPPGVPAEIGRHGFRGGLIVRMPIIEERKPRVTR